MEIWGRAIAYVFANLEPYRCHALALEEMRKSWDVTTAEGRLSYDAIYEGTGMYWTLRDSYQFHIAPDTDADAGAAESIIENPPGNCCKRPSDPLSLDCDRNDIWAMLIAVMCVMSCSIF